jgi:hypothetical protein
MIKTTFKCAVLVGFATALMLASSPSQAQNASLPDWSGVWAMQGGTVFDRATQVGTGGSTTPGVRIQPPYNAEYEARYKANLAKRDAARLPDVLTNCGIPAGFPRVFNLPDPYEFVIRPEQVWILTENGPNIMRIYTDGRASLKPEERWGTYTGFSTGKWEGDTLVFETVNLKGGRDSDSILDRTGATLSDAAESTTRVRRINPETIEVVMNIRDPKAFTPGKTWTVTKQFRKMPVGTSMYDYGCAENNRNPATEEGETLTLGPDGKPLQ